MRENWSDKEVETLKAMWNDSASASQISKALGTGRSRNAVLGQVHRMNLASRAPSGRCSRPANAGPKAPQIKAPTPIENTTPSEDPGPMDPPISLIDLHDRHCKWPYDTPEGGHRYCGRAPKAGRPWCPYHCSRGYQPQQSKKAVA